MKIPFPTKHSFLPKVSHMYICLDKQEEKYQFLKCQTFKWIIIKKKLIQNYTIEDSNINRNPFSKETLIDLDKIFITSTVKYDDRMKTEIRSNISNDLFIELKNQLKDSQVNIINLNEQELKLLNKWIN
ncbi:hypothetical protein ACXX84_04065 [Mycoplasma sp. AC157]